MQLLAHRPELAPVLLAAVMRTSAIAATPLMGRYPASDIAFIARMALAGRLLSTGKTELFLRHRQGSGGQIDTMGDYEAMIAANKPAQRPLAPWIWARWRFFEATGMVLHSGFPLSERLALAKIVGEVAALRGRGWLGRQVPDLPGLLPVGRPETDPPAPLREERARTHPGEPLALEPDQHRLPLSARRRHPRWAGRLQRRLRLHRHRLDGLSRAPYLTPAPADVVRPVTVPYKDGVSVG